MECMATSDNVIRAGLTPKLRWVSALKLGAFTWQWCHGKAAALQVLSLIAGHILELQSGTTEILN